MDLKSTPGQGLTSKNISRYSSQVSYILFRAPRARHFFFFRNLESRLSCNHRSPPIGQGGNGKTLSFLLTYANFKLNAARRLRTAIQLIIPSITIPVGLSLGPSSLGSTRRKNVKTKSRKRKQEKKKENREKRDREREREERDERRRNATEGKKKKRKNGWFWSRYGTKAWMDERSSDDDS